MKTDIYFAMNEEETAAPSFPTYLSVTPGIWMDGKTYWVRDSSEKMIPEESISIHVRESSLHSKTRIHDVFIKNHGNRSRDIKVLFIHYYPKITKEVLSFVSPAEQSIFHIKNERIFLVNGQCQDRTSEQMTVQPLWNIHTDLIWQSTENGVLKYQPMAKGMAGSIFSLRSKVGVNKICKASAWMVFGNNKNELLQLNQYVKNTLAFPPKR